MQLKKNVSVKYLNVECWAIFNSVAVHGQLVPTIYTTTICRFKNITSGYSFKNIDYRTKIITELQEF